MSAMHPRKQWVPFDNFYGVEYIAKGGFSRIYKGTWENKIDYSTRWQRWKKQQQVVLKVLNNSQNVDTEFLNELKLTYQFKSKFVIKCHGVTQDPKTKNYALILKYAQDGNLHHYLSKNFEELTWIRKILLFKDIVSGIKELHKKEINIKPQMYGVIPYMAPELFKEEPYTFASDIYSLGMITWELTTGHKPFHDQEHGPILILDILDGKRPEITKDTPEYWKNLMEKCWHSDPSQRPTIDEIIKLFDRCNYAEVHIKEYYSEIYDIWPEYKEAEKKRLEMINTKTPFTNNPGYEHQNSKYYSVSLDSMLESINLLIQQITARKWRFAQSNSHPMFRKAE
ncbi:hypothetical protein Glove_853g10 [Diversispora epigaea]|uniref:Protein kinase domain-containing protein n=1 Tax=Diversispora epigaea TaxID=1348612 RepID=A0A397G6S0_9GLOM|nr:hypothetical protein Glove_853g10 [Diversispora epigaea]